MDFQTMTCPKCGGRGVTRTGVYGRAETCSQCWGDKVVALAGKRDADGQFLRGVALRRATGPAGQTVYALTYVSDGATLGCSASNLRDLVAELARFQGWDCGWRAQTTIKAAIRANYHASRRTTATDAEVAELWNEERDLRAELAQSEATVLTEDDLSAMFRDDEPIREGHAVRVEDGPLAGLGGRVAARVGDRIDVFVAGRLDIMTFAPDELVRAACDGCGKLYEMMAHIVPTDGGRDSFLCDACWSARQTSPAPVFPPTQYGTPAYWQRLNELNCESVQDLTDANQALRAVADAARELLDGGTVNRVRATVRLRDLLRDLDAIAR